MRGRPCKASQSPGCNDLEQAISMTTLRFHGHCHPPPTHGIPQDAQVEHPLTSQQPEERSVMHQAWLSSVEASRWPRGAETGVSPLFASPGQHAGKVAAVTMTAKHK